MQRETTRSGIQLHWEARWEHRNFLDRVDSKIVTMHVDFCHFMRESLCEDPSHTIEHGLRTNREYSARVRRCAVFSASWGEVRGIGAIQPRH